MQAQAEEDIRLKILEYQTANNGTEPTLKQLAEYLETLKDEYDVVLTGPVAKLKDNTIIGSISSNTEKIYVTKTSIGAQVEVTNNLQVTATNKVETASSEGSNSESQNNSGQTGENQTPTSTLASVTTANYGDYINLGTNILSVQDTPTLSDGKAIEGDWRIFYKDNTFVYAILSSYLPNDNSVILDQGLTAISGSDYAVNVGTNRYDLVSKLEPMENMTNNWNSLIGTSLINKGAKVYGTPNIGLWIASWNEKYSTIPLYTPTSGNGFYIGISSSATTTDIDLSSYDGYIDTIFYPYRANNFEGYWISSVSAYNSTDVFCLDPGGIIGRDAYNNSITGIRPIVLLPLNIPVTSITNQETEVTSWTVN